MGMAAHHPTSSNQARAYLLLPSPTYLTSPHLTSPHRPKEGGEGEGEGGDGWKRHSFPLSSSISLLTLLCILSNFCLPTES